MCCMRLMLAINYQESKGIGIGEGIHDKHNSGLSSNHLNMKCLYISIFVKQIFFSWLIFFMHFYCLPTGSKRNPIIKVVAMFPPASFHNRLNLPQSLGAAPGDVSRAERHESLYQALCLGHRFKNVN